MGFGNEWCQVCCHAFLSKYNNKSSRKDSNRESTEKGTLQTPEKEALPSPVRTPLDKLLKYIRSNVFTVPLRAWSWRGGFSFSLCPSFPLRAAWLSAPSGCFWRPCDVLSQWEKSKSIQSYVIAPRTPRMDSDSRPLRLIKFRIRIRKGTTGVCIETKDMLMRLFQYTPWDPFPILISPMLWPFIQLW